MRFPLGLCDLGNTRVRLASASVDPGKPPVPVFDADAARTDAEQVAAGLADCGWVECLVSSVNPAAEAAVAAGLSRVGARAVFIRPGERAIMPHRLSTPETTGPDRLFAALAARESFREAGDGGAGCAVAMAGTALTIDWVDAAGTFRGGYIMPGPELWLGGLSKAALLPDLRRDAPLAWRTDPGDGTRAAMANGAAAGLRGAARMAVEEIRRLAVAEGGRPEDFRLALGGGWAEALEPAFAEFAPLRKPHWVLEGLQRWAAMSGWTR